jgi:hypothetical protein
MTKLEQRATLRAGALLAGFLLAGVALQLLLPERFAVQCLMKRWFSVPCPTCGMTRALRLLLHCEWRAAVALQPLVLIGPLFALLAFLYWTLRPAVPAAQKFRPLAGIALLVFLLNWIGLIVAGR